MIRLWQWFSWLWRSLKWAIRSLWLGYPAPRVDKKPFSRSYMRKAWRDRLSTLDRKVNDGEGNKAFLLMERRIMVAKRRAFRFE